MEKTFEKLQIKDDFMFSIITGDNRYFRRCKKRASGYLCGGWQRDCVQY